MLEELIQVDLVAAMKSKDTATLDTLRIVKSEITKFKTSPDFKGKVEDEDVINILKGMVKQNQKNIETAKSVNRMDIVKKNEDEIAIFEKYLPAKMSTEDAEKEIQAIIAETGATSMKEMGKVMGAVKQKLGDALDGKTISDIVKRLLS